MPSGTADNALDAGGGRVSKKCGYCVHWRNTLTGWCDYYSWPMDIDDDEPCKAYEPLAECDDISCIVTVDELQRIARDVKQHKGDRLRGVLEEWSGDQDRVDK